MYIASERKKALFTLIILLIFVCSCLACQQTPQRPVINSSNSQEKKQLGNGSSVLNEVPQRWQESIQMQHITVEIDAAIVCPNQDDYPATLVERHQFEAEDVQAFVTALISKPTRVRPQGEGYDELTDALKRAVRGIYLGDDPKTGEAIYGNYAEQEEDIARIQEQLLACGGEDVWNTVTEKSYAPALSSVFQNEEGKTAYVSARTNAVEITTCYEATIQPETWVSDDGGYPGEAPHLLEHVQLTCDEAQAQAERYLMTAGVKSMTLATAEKARILIPPYTTASEGWRLTYVLDDGTSDPISTRQYDSGYLRFPTIEAYAAAWKHPFVIMYVDADGVQTIRLEDFLEEIDQGSPNTQRISFAEAQTAICDMLKYTLTYLDSTLTDETGITVAISRIVLSRCLQPIKNDIERAYLAPTWLIPVTLHDANGFENTSLFAISALDGSFVHLNGN